MRKIHIITVTAVLACAIFGATYISAQEMKAPSNVSQSYPDLSFDMQYYEIKYDPNSEEYLSYYRVIREKIMQKLRGLYRHHYANGDVYLFFTLNSDGRLDRFDVDRSRSVDNGALIDIATTSLKRSSPFPKFPEALSSPRVSFHVVISFKEK